MNRKFYKAQSPLGDIYIAQTGDAQWYLTTDSIDPAQSFTADQWERRGRTTITINGIAYSVSMHVNLVTHMEGPNNDQPTPYYVTANNNYCYMSRQSDDAWRNRNTDATPAARLKAEMMLPTWLGVWLEQHPIEALVLAENNARYVAEYAYAKRDDYQKQADTMARNATEFGWQGDQYTDSANDLRHKRLVAMAGKIFERIFSRPPNLKDEDDEREVGEIFDWLADGDIKDTDTIESLAKEWGEDCSVAAALDSKADAIA